MKFKILATLLISQLIFNPVMANIEELEPSAEEARNRVLPHQSKVQVNTSTSTSTEFTKPRIKKVQSKLKQEGFYSASNDGVIGPKTRQAIEDYQEKNNLDASGELDIQTLRKMGMEDMATDQQDELYSE